MANTILIVLLLTVIAGLGIILSLRERKRECINDDVVFGYKDGLPTMHKKERV